VVSGLADEVCVVYAGKIVERGKVDAVLDAPLHPYTRGLIESVPDRGVCGRPLPQIPGSPPSPLSLPAGCAFRDRCPRADAACLAEPALEAIDAASQRDHRAVRCFHPHREPFPAPA